MVPSVEKKIAELEMGLLHLQQNIDIPEISLAIHPVVTAMVKKCAEDGRRPKVQDFGDKVEDSTFLNQLQNGVNRWIREIQKVMIVKYCFCVENQLSLGLYFDCLLKSGQDFIGFGLSMKIQPYEVRCKVNYIEQDRYLYSLSTKMKHETNILIFQCTCLYG